MIGDNYEADILGALNNGFEAIHLNSNNQPPHNSCIVINDLIELKELLWLVVLLPNYLIKNGATSYWNIKGFNFTI